MDDTPPHYTDDRAKLSWPTWVGGCLLILYLAAMLLPAMNETPHIGGGTTQDTLWGWEAFLFSFVLIHIPVWAANPLFAAGVFSLFRGKVRTVAVTGGLATALALFWPILGMMTRRPIPALQLDNFGIGYWLWLACMIGILLAGSIRWLQCSSR